MSRYLRKKNYIISQNLLYISRKYIIVKPRYFILYFYIKIFLLNFFYIQIFILIFYIKFKILINF